MKTINLSKIILTITLLAVSIFSNETAQIQKPVIFEFGKSMEFIKRKLTSNNLKFTERLNEPIQLPTAQKSQSQIDVEGFLFEGKKRKVELIFGDDQLDIIWILTEAEEEQKFIDAFTKQYVKPTHQMKEATFFIKDRVAVRNTPHEVLFLSERLQGPYTQWLDSQSKQ